LTKVITRFFVKCGQQVIGIQINTVQENKSVRFPAFVFHSTMLSADFFTIKNQYEIIFFVKECPSTRFGNVNTIFDCFSFILSPESAICKPQPTPYNCFMSILSEKWISPDIRMINAALVRLAIRHLASFRFKYFTNSCKTNFGKRLKLKSEKVELSTCFQTLPCAQCLVTHFELNFSFSRSWFF